MNKNVLTKKRMNIRKLTMTAMLAAVSTVLMFFSFNVPLMPAFIKMDFSELPAILASFTLGPVSGIVVCFVKNLINLCFSTTGGIGELSNFILGVFFVLPAGLIYKKWPGYKSAITGSIVGAAAMALCSVVSNYYIVYPIYAQIMPIDAIIGMYQAINPGTDGLWSCLLIFNMPFTFIKGIACAIIAILIYKPLLPILSGRGRTQ